MAGAHAAWPREVHTWRAIFNGPGKGHGPGDGVPPALGSSGGRRPADKFDEGRVQHRGLAA